MSTVGFNSSLAQKATWFVGLSILRIGWVIFIMYFVATFQANGAAAPIGAPFPTVGGSPITNGHIIVKVMSFVADKGVSAISPIFPHLLSEGELMITQGIFHVVGFVGALVTSLYIHQDQGRDAYRNRQWLRFTNHFLLPILVTVAHLVNIGLSFAASDDLEKIKMKKAQELLIHLPALLHILNHGLRVIN